MEQDRANSGIARKGNTEDRRINNLTHHHAISAPRLAAYSISFRPTRIERRARLVSAAARGRRWLNEIVSGSVTDIEQIATRQKCSTRQVNMTFSLAFLAPDLVRVAVQGRCHAALGSSDFVMVRQNGARVRSPRIKSAIITDRARNLASQDFLIFPVCQTALAVENPAAGNGILGCRDGRLKSA